MSSFYVSLVAGEHSNSSSLRGKVPYLTNMPIAPKVYWQKIFKFHIPVKALFQFSENITLPGLQTKDHNHDYKHRFTVWKFNYYPPSF